MPKSTGGPPLVAALEGMTDEHVTRHFKLRHPEDVSSWDPTLNHPDAINQGTPIRLAGRIAWEHWHSWLHLRGRGSAPGHVHSH
jgi:hypothetical protein